MSGQSPVSGCLSVRRPTTINRLMILTVLVAMSTACDERRQPPVVPSSPHVDSADQVMFGMRSLLTDRGLLRAELFADTAYFFDDNTRIELSNVHVTFFTTTGQKNADLDSEEGSYSTRSGMMEARENVVVVSVDGRRLTTEQLRYDQTKNQISSDSAFVLTEPGRVLRGIGFVSDPDMTNVRVLRGAQGTTVIEGPPARPDTGRGGTGSPITRPRQ